MLIRLYPAGWRKRYGDELEELISDAPAGLRTPLDIFKNAISIRLKSLATIRILLVCLAAGVLSGGAASYLMPEVWEVTAVAMMAPSRISSGFNRPVSIQKIGETLTSLQSLTALLNDTSLNLYPNERRTQPLENLAEKMRRNINVHIDKRTKSGGAVFTVSFRYPDARKARDAAKALVRVQFEPSARIDPAFQKPRADYFIDLLDLPALPRKPIPPGRVVFILAGLFAGLLLAAATLLIRRQIYPPGPGLHSE